MPAPIATRGPFGFAFLDALSDYRILVQGCRGGAPLPDAVRRRAGEHRRGRRALESAV